MLPAASKPGFDAINREDRSTRRPQGNGSLMQESPIASSQFRQTAVLVLGMHRSGTSLLSSLVQSLGISVGDNLIPGDMHNPAGYFEDRKCVDIQERMLEALGQPWATDKGMLPFPARWWHDPAMRPLVNELELWIDKRQFSCKRVWSLKDPRTTRFLPLWQELLQRRGITPRYLLAVRDPAEVAASEMKRDQVPAERVYRIWLRYNMEALLHAGADLAGVFAFDQWFTDGIAQLRRLAMILGVSPATDACHATIGQLVRGELRRHKGCTTSPPVWASYLYRRLRSLSDQLSVHEVRGLAAEAEYFDGLLRQGEDPSTEGALAAVLPTVEGLPAALELAHRLHIEGARVVLGIAAGTPAPTPPGAAVVVREETGPTVLGEEKTRAAYALWRWLQQRKYAVVHIEGGEGLAAHCLDARRQGLPAEHGSIHVNYFARPAWLDEDGRVHLHSFAEAEALCLERRIISNGEACLLAPPTLLAMLRHLAADDPTWSRRPISSNGEPLVSVCICHHNRPEMLNDCLASVRAQTYCNLEVILVDDGSTQPAARIFVDSLEQEFKDKGWTLVRQENRYLGGARNAAAQAAKGEYLFILDDDNLLIPDGVERAVRVAQNTNADIVTAVMAMFQGPAGTNPTWPDNLWVFPGGAPLLGLFGNTFGDANGLVRRLCLDELHGFTDDRGVGAEDWEFFAKAALRGYCLEHSLTPLSWYRVMESGMARSGNQWNDYRRALRAYETVLPPALRELPALAGVLRRRESEAEVEANQLCEDLRATRNSLMAIEGQVQNLTRAAMEREASPMAERLLAHGSRAGLVAAREELIVLRNAFAALEGSRRAEQIQIAELTRLQKAEAARAEAAVARSADEAASSRARAEQAEIRSELILAEGREATDRATELARALAEVEAELYGVRTSTAWLSTWPFRAVGARLPRRVRRTVRCSAKIVWWTTTFKLPRRLRERRENHPRMDLIPPAQFEQLEADVVSQHSEPLHPPLYWPYRQTIAQRLKSRTEPVDIVICVHNALTSLQACVESVLRCTMPPYRVVIVDDGSSSETASYLERQVEEQKFLLLRNTEAKGYTRAANAGLRAVTAPWVVLLNSDTIVTPGWLDRMWAHGERDSSIGVIGPISNTASWQSVPRIFDGDDWAENSLPTGITVDELSMLVARGALGAISMPFVNGFCLMIRSSLLESVGVFDEATFGAGYGEENDFCIRVRNAGWRLVVATDAYVYHAQSRSYSADRRLELAKRADQLLLEKHDPRRDIWPQVAECRNCLAMASVRAHLEAALLGRELTRNGRAKYEGKRIAFVLPVSSLGGGANVVLEEGAALQRMGVDVTLLGFEALLHSVGPLARQAALQVATFANPEAITRYLQHEQDRYDAVVATLYRSVYWLPLQTDLRFGYYIQDFEPYFFCHDDPEYMTALQSYTYSDRLKLMTKTLWNQKEVESHTRRRPLVLGPSVDTTTFAPGPNRRVGDPIRIAAMVRPSTPRRAPERTLAVLNRVAGQIGASAALTIFGSTDDELKAAKLDSSWIRNVGRLERAGMAALLADTDIFLDCSDYQAMGLTALEAMLAGCAVIAPERGGCNDFIRTGQNGLLVNSMDEAACADAVVWLAKDETALLEIQLKAVADAGKYIPERAAVRLLEAIFDD